MRLRDVFQAHESALQLGGLAGIREVALLESAIGRPYTGYYRRTYQKAAALVESLVQNHGFIDGNKRTAFIVTRLFLERSGYMLNGILDPPDVELEHLIVGIAGAHPLQEPIADWFRRRLEPL